jgi:NitT/TauT family transport system substrate-binding protein
MIRHWLRMAMAACAVALIAPLPAHAQDTKPELARLRLAVGGQAALYYLPLTVTERLGYFKDAGLNVEIADLKGGSQALQALVGGSADVVTGAFDHTIQMAAKNQPIVATVQLGRFPGFALGVINAKAAVYKDARDLKGMKIGVTAPGSSTHFMVMYMMARAGLKPDDAAYVGVGATSTAIAAVRRAEIDAIVNADPSISMLTSENLIKVVADTRTPEGTRLVYGGLYPAAVLYMPPAFVEKNPRTVQALVNAFVRALKWIDSHSAEDIVKVMPEEYALGDKVVYTRSVAASKAMYSPDGRFTRDGPETALKVLAEFDAAVKGASINLDKTFTNAFVEKAQATN